MVAFFGVRVDEGWRERDFLLDVDDGSVRSSFMLPALLSAPAVNTPSCYLPQTEHGGALNQRPVLL